MHILITGGAGYIGTFLTEILSQHPKVTQVTAYDNLQAGNTRLFWSTKVVAEKMHFVQADILDSRTLSKYMAKADVLLHAAGIGPDARYTESHIYEQINHWGTSEVCNAAELHKVQKVLFISDIAVLGASSAHTPESENPNPTSSYAWSKLRAENHLNRLPEKTKRAIIRPGIVYGLSAGSLGKGLVNDMVFDSHVKGRISIEGNGRNTISITSLTYLANAVVHAVFEPNPDLLYTVVQHCLPVLDVVEELKNIYPELEFIFINPHLQKADNAVQLPTKATETAQKGTAMLQTELTGIKASFRF